MLQLRVLYFQQLNGNNGMYFISRIACIKPETAISSNVVSHPFNNFTFVISPQEKKNALPTVGASYLFYTVAPFGNFEKSMAPYMFQHSAEIIEKNDLNKK